MRNIDEDNITQAVIAGHAAADDVRLREVMTSLVQHLHAFAREVRLDEREWAEGLRFIAECGGPRGELDLLSDTLGMSTLVTAMNRRRPRGCTAATAAGTRHVESASVDDAPDELCFVCGRVCALDGKPIAGARIRVWPRAATAPDAGHGNAAQCAPAEATSGVDGRFGLACIAAQPLALPQDGPVGRMLRALGRHAWRPAHLRFDVSAPGYERLSTNVFRADDPYLETDAAFGVRSSLIADWVHHPPGRTPDGHDSAVPFYQVDFTFVLTTTGDKP